MYICIKNQRFFKKFSYILIFTNPLRTADKFANSNLSQKFSNKTG